MSSNVEVFTRKASGLVRDMSPFSAFIYNILTMGLIFPWTYLWGPSAFPGGSIAKGVLLATALEIPIALAYVWLASAMPRSGGDYVFQSRIFGGGIGFAIVFSGFVVWILQWVALSGWLMAVLGIAPMFLGLGASFGSKALIAFGMSVQSPTGVVITSVLFSFLATVLLTRRFKNYVKLQYVLFYATLIAFGIMLIQFLRTSPEQFAAGINKFAATIDGTQGFYTKTIADVAATGWNVNPAFSWAATMGIAPIAWTSLQWATYSCEQGGEIKGASNFKNQMFIIVGSLIVTGLLLALLGWAEQRAVGSQFLTASAAGYYYKVGPGLGSVNPFPNILAIGLSASPVVVVLISLGYIANAFQIFCNCYIGMTRNIVAMSLDRVLPEWASRVHPKLHSPVNAHVAYFLASILWILAYNYVPNWATYTLGVTFASGYVFVFSSLAAALLPYRAKQIYEASPGAKYKFLGIPLVTIMGLLGFICGGFMVVSFLIFPQFGLTGTVPYLLVGGIVVITLLIYAAARMRQSTKGIDIGNAFREIPPE
ncbi:MAG: APC family permease [Eubacteriales bacterium]